MYQRLKNKKERKDKMVCKLYYIATSCIMAFNQIKLIYLFKLKSKFVFNVLLKVKNKIDTRSKINL